MIASDDMGAAVAVASIPARRPGDRLHSCGRQSHRVKDRRSHPGHGVGPCRGAPQSDSAFAGLVSDAVRHVLAAKDGAGLLPCSARQLSRGGRREALAAAGAGALLAGTWITATGGGVPAWEADVFHWVNDLPDGLWGFGRVPMQLGSVAGSLGVVAVTAVAAHADRG